MNKEIKEILDKLKDSVNYPIIDVPTMDGTDSEPMENSVLLEPNESKIILDYITNLEQENEELKVENEKLTQLWLNSQEKRRKAIKYLEQPYRDNFDYSKSELLNILTGGDE